MAYGQGGGYFGSYYGGGEPQFALGQGLRHLGQLLANKRDQAELDRMAELESRNALLEKRATEQMMPGATDIGSFLDRFASRTQAAQTNPETGEIDPTMASPAGPLTDDTLAKIANAGEEMAGPDWRFTTPERVDVDIPGTDKSFGYQPGTPSMTAAGTLIDPELAREQQLSRGTLNSLLQAGTMKEYFGGSDADAPALIREAKAAGYVNPETGEVDVIGYVRAKAAAERAPAKPEEPKVPRMTDIKAARELLQNRFADFGPDGKFRGYKNGVTDSWLDQAASEYVRTGEVPEPPRQDFGSMPWMMWGGGPGATSEGPVTTLEDAPLSPRPPTAPQPMPYDPSTDTRAPNNARDYWAYLVEVKKIPEEEATRLTNDKFAAQVNAMGGPRKYTPIR